MMPDPLMPDPLCPASDAALTTQRPAQALTSGLLPRARAPLGERARTAVGYALFGPRHGLTPEQAQLAMRLWWRAWQARGPVTGWRRALRMAGILRAVKYGLVGNAAWGRRMLATRGGKARARQRRDGRPPKAAPPRPLPDPSEAGWPPGAAWPDR